MGLGTESTDHPCALTGLGGWPTSTQATEATSMYWSRTGTVGSSVPTANLAHRPTLGCYSPFGESSSKGSPALVLPSEEPQ